MALNTTLIGQLNQGLKVVGDPELATQFTSTNTFQQHLIEAVNDAVDDIRERFDYEWLLKNTQFVTTAAITSGTVAVTNGDATVTSTDSDGNAADNFTNVAAGMWLRMGTEVNSYSVSSVSTGASPDTLELTQNYIDTTATGASYTILQDTYALTATDMEQVEFFTYGDARTFIESIGGVIPDSRIHIVSMDRIMQYSGGDLHRDSGGRPRFAARIGPNGSDQQQYVFWPYPKDQHLINVWYEPIFTTITATSSTIFGGDAPRIAYTAVAHRVKAAAHLWDKQMDEANIEMQQYNLSVAQLVRKENREAKDTSMDIETYRRSYNIRFPVRSGIYFDTKGAKR